MIAVVAHILRGTATHQIRASERLVFATRARQGEMAVIENRVTSDHSKLIKEKAANLDGPAGPPAPERDDANEYAAYWQADYWQAAFWQPGPWFFPAVPGTYGNSYRAGDE